MKDRPGWAGVFPLLLLVSLAPLEGQAAGEDHHPGRVLVKFKAGGRASFLSGSARSERFEGDPDLYRVGTPARVAVQDAVAEYRKNPNVLYAEPDYVIRGTAIPNDPLWDSQWNLATISASQAWDLETDSSDVVVAVLDSGVDSTHPDLQANLWTDPTDGTQGYDCVTRTPGGEDALGHGTHVAGIIGAVANNGVGIAGINWSARLMPLKFMNESGYGAVSDAVYCLDRVVMLKQSGVNIRVVNASWGTRSYSQALQDAIDRAEAADLLLVCAAGNDGRSNDFFPFYPASFTNRAILSVAASDSSDEITSFSNVGSVSVDIAAPGDEVLSTFSRNEGSDYAILSGTSQAAPHVSGVAAALFHRNPALSAFEARDVLLDPASVVPIGPGLAASTTGGRLDFLETLTNPLVSAPSLNGFPTLDRDYPNIFLQTGRRVTFRYDPSDPDGDPIRAVLSNVASGFPTTAVYRWALTQAFPYPTAIPFTLTAPAISRTTTVPYSFGVVDGRGGSTQDQVNVTVGRSTTPGLAPGGTLTVAPVDGPPDTASFQVSLSAADPEGGPVSWELQYSSGFSQFQTGVSSQILSLPLDLWESRSLRLKAMMVDRELNVAYSNSVVVHPGSAVGEPPIIDATAFPLYGYAPVTVTIRYNGSFDPDGEIAWYWHQCDSDGLIYVTYDGSPKTCRFETPGVHQVFVAVVDNQGDSDTSTIPIHAVALPDDPVPPQVLFLSPGTGSRVYNPVSLVAAATDNLGILSVCFHDGAREIGCAYDPPYTIWATLRGGPQVLSARATDFAGNLAVSAPVSITVGLSSRPRLSADPGFGEGPAP